MKRSPLVLVLTAASAAAIPFAAFAQHDDHKHTPQPAQSQPHDDGKTPGSPAKAEAKRPSDPYPLATCPVSGKKLGMMGDPVVKEYDGRQVRFCCDGCIEKFEASKDDYWKKVDDQIVKDQKPFYPLTTCVISGEPLVEDGKDIAVNYVYRNRLIRFCCRGCIKDFLKDPEPALKKLDATSIHQQRAHYPLSTCVVSGEQLGSMGDPYEVVIGNRLVRLCCKSCENDLRAKPQDHLPKLDEAWKQKGMPHATDKVPAEAMDHNHDDKPDTGDKHNHGGK
jgi:YHS domain-containing protein